MSLATPELVQQLEGELTELLGKIERANAALDDAPMTYLARKTLAFQVDDMQRYARTLGHRVSMAREEAAMS